MALARLAPKPTSAGVPGGKVTSQPGAISQRQPRPVLPPGTHAFTWALTALAALAAWVLLYAGVFSGFQEAGSQHALYANLRSEIAQEVAPPFQNYRFGKPVAILRVPQAGIDDVVVDGTTSGLLEEGPGLLPDSPLPGQPGVSYIFGRRATFGGPFAHLNVLRKGDLLDVTTGEGTFTYRVSDVRLPGDPEPPALTPGQSRLTLVTVVGSGWRSFLAPDKLLYVDASLVGRADARKSGLPSAVPSSELAMHGDSSILFELVLWLQLLVLTVLVAVWVRLRWSGWQTWLVITPALLAVLWVVSETAAQLLPNLL